MHLTQSGRELEATDLHVQLGEKRCVIAGRERQRGEREVM